MNRKSSCIENSQRGNGDGIDERKHSSYKVVQIQRAQYKRKMKDRKTALSDGRIKLLNNIGFSWGRAEATPKKTKRQDDEARVPQLWQ
mmetsp:Transcript_54562/g.115923  ORF Transcript_54562/g.115923 Transcript_54562/m.115923 type:complete len:88 (+) Transcript_54562:436-699(+)